MPAFVTHNYFAKDVYEKLDKNIKKELASALDFYAMFAQSFDNLFYYRLPLLIGKDIRHLGHIGQKSNTQSYFINMIRNIMTNNLEKNPEALAYLYGSITHYVLDSTVHPFVFYKTGIYDKKDKTTWKYNNKHAKMEYMLDVYMYESRNQKPIYKWNFKKEMFPKLKPSKEILGVIDATFDKTFHKKGLGKIFFKSYKWSRFLNVVGKKDRFGIKKGICSAIDILLGKGSNLKYYSLHIKKVDLSFLNLERKTWNHPSNLSLTFNYSFLDLYEIAKKQAIKTITAIDLVLNKKEDISILLEEIPNISYLTGFLITKNYPLKHFEY